MVLARVRFLGAHDTNQQKENKMQATYYVRSVYGTPTRYPENEAARTIAKIAGTKTLRLSDMEKAENGLDVQWSIVADPELPIY